MSPTEQRKVVIAATTCAVIVIASQIAGKAARDAIFLQQFEVTNLPLLLAVSSALAIGTTFYFARHLSRGAPARIVQLANAGSAVLLVAEWLLLDRAPRPVATIIYIHQTLLGPILVSGFWSIVSESFDPRTARQVIGTIGTGATIGGLVGALLAERVAAMIGTQFLLPTIAGLQVLAVWRLAAMGAHGTAAVVAKREGDAEHVNLRSEIKDVASKIVSHSLLRKLALITVTVTVAAALLDYVFKAMVSGAVKKPDDLARAFAMFHGGVGLLTALLSWLLGQRALQKWGLARTLATLPGSVILFGALALVAPGVGTFILLRGSENVVRNSLYREAYEVFYTPLRVDERRATKTIIDVGVERFGDVVGGLLVIVILAVAIESTAVLLAGAIGLSVVGVMIALQAQHSYVEALERSLADHAIDLTGSENQDRTTRRTLELMAHRSSGTMPAARSSRWPFRGGKRGPPERGVLDPTLKRLGELTSGDAARIKAALASALLSPASLAHATPLLARADVVKEVRQAITHVARAYVGQLIDAMRDAQLPAAARAELPSLIAATRSKQGAGGLLACLDDAEFDVRYLAARALLEMRELDPELPIDKETVFQGVRRELAVEPERWKELVNTPAESLPGTAAMSRAATHLSALLALALPAEPVKTAIHGMWSDDPALRGVSLEYLENVLPPDIRERIWVLLQIELPEPATASVKRSFEELRAHLLQKFSDPTASSSGLPLAELAKLAEGDS